MSNKEQKVPSHHLMLVEDDIELASLIKDFLTKHNFHVSIINDGHEAVSRIIDEQPDIVILDIMLPGQSGMDVCRLVRDKYKGAILMQTALDDDIDQMMGLELGADDYIIKQVQPRLLLSRIKALLRRQNHHSNTDIRVEASLDTVLIGDLVINLASRTVTLKNTLIELTTAEFELLYLLAKQPGQVVSRDSIVQQVRGYEYDGLDRSIDRRVSRLRRKLQDDLHQPKLIKTVRGQGYQLCKH